ncbi:MAG: hypothetical protein AAFO61_01400 [Pseudomonadota bacterium]
MNTLNFENYETQARKILREDGIQIRWGNDFANFKRLVARCPERHAPAPGFDPDHARGQNLDGIWLAAYNGSGTLIHTQAARREVITPNFSHHLSHEGECYEPSYWRFDSERSATAMTPAAAAITGDAIYHGENWVKGNPNGYRGGHFIYLFCRLMLARILQTWDAAHIYGFVTPETASRGLAQRVGYMRCEQGTLTFEQDNAPDVELWLVWMTREEALFNLRLEPAYFVKRYGNAELSKVA